MSGNIYWKNDYLSHWKWGFWLLSRLHLNLGWEKMEVKLCGESNYLRDQPGTNSRLTARITGLREKNKTLINHLISKVTSDWTAPKLEFTVPKIFHWFIVVHISKPYINTNILCIRIMNRRKSFPFTHNSTSLALQCFHVQGKEQCFISPSTSKVGPKTTLSPFGLHSTP